MLAHTYTHTHLLFFFLVYEINRTRGQFSFLFAMNLKGYVLIEVPW